MLLWLQKGQASKLRIFKFKIFIVSIFIHLILLFFILFFNFNEPLKIEIKSGRYTLPLVFLPLQKTVPGALSAIKNSNIENKDNSSSASKAKIIIEKNLNGSKTNQNSKKVVSIKKVEKVEAKTKIFVDQNKIKKDQITKEQEKIKKDEEKKIEQKQQQEKILEKEIDQPQETPKIEEIKNDSKSVEIVEGSVQEEAIYIGRQDLEQIEIEELVKREIESHWRPPAGLPKNLQCSIKVIIDNCGKAQNIQILKSSKSIAFDLKAKKDIVEVVFPKELWQREIILNFG